MNIKEKLAAIALAVPVTFRYARKYDENINGDDANYPAAVFIEPDQGGFNVTSLTGSVRDRHNIFIQFVNKTVMGEQAIDRLTVVEAMKTLAAKYIIALNNSNVFEDISPSGYNWMLVVDAYDVNVAGIELNIPNLIEREIRPC